MSQILLQLLNVCAVRWCRAQKQAIDLESEIEAMEAEMERQAADKADAGAARAALRAAQAEASELRSQVGGTQGCYVLALWPLGKLGAGH